MMTDEQPVCFSPVSVMQMSISSQPSSPLTLHYKDTLLLLVGEDGTNHISTTMWSLFFETHKIQK